jgi:hypothetical protein
MFRIIVFLLAGSGMATALPCCAQDQAAKPAPPTDSVSDIGYMTASQLATRCSQSDPAGSSYCFAYIAAVTDTARAYEIWLGSKEFCLPARIAQSEVRRAFMTYVSAYPSKASGQAASVVVNALKLTYPCD